MRFFLPQPIHGWRAFWGEVGIIVLGVLIALAAQRLVDEMRWRSDVEDFRQSVRAEISENLGTYPKRARQKQCIKLRLEELQRWLDKSRAGQFSELAGIIGIPASLVIRSSAWEGRDPETLSHMPRQERLDLGHLYSEFANNEIHRLDERAAWIELASFNGVDQLTHEDQMRLQGLIFRARLRDQRIDENYGRFVKRAALLDIVPRGNPEWPDGEMEHCGSIFSAEIDTHTPARS